MNSLLLTCVTVGLSLSPLLVDCLTTKGSVRLDSITFDKMLSKFKVSIVKFDNPFPYGEKHDEFEKVAKAVGSTPDLLIGDVGVADYGDKENMDLAERFELKKDDFPFLLMFKDGSSIPIKYSGEWKEDDIKLFLREKSGLRLQIEGTIAELDNLAEKFIDSESKATRESILKQSEELVKTLNGSQKDSGDIYVKLMQKVVERGDKFLESEGERLRNLLTGKISDAKKKTLQLRLNIIASFQRKTSPSAKDDL